MAVVKNLMIRIGADYSAAKKGMEGASKQLGRFKNDTTKATTAIKGRNGLGGIAAEFTNLGRSVSASFSRIRGAKGIGGVTRELGTLTPALKGSANGMKALGAGTVVASSRLGIFGLAVGVTTVAVAGLVAGLYKASQPAVKFEADIGRLNMQLKDGSRAYMDWAKAQGLAKITAVELGATYGTLLSSFIKDNKELQIQTQDLVQATRIVSSATGRSLDDTFNRIRSGMLGSTEAIEDLGIYVNISMIESTAAFKRFAGDKSWAQLDFQMQQQIRLAAILEQTYSRYGNELQRNTMTKQERLMEQLKDIKLHWSQSFQPIWDSVIPALTQLAQGVSWVVEQFARLAYWVKGWDYDEMTKGTDKNTGAVDDLGNALEETGEQAAKAKKELAGFDQLNLIGGNASAGGSGTGTGGSGTTGDTFKTPTGDGSPMPNIPAFPKLRLEFDPPHPPDAGMGAVATAVVSTNNSMAAEVNRIHGGLWARLREQTEQGMQWQEQKWVTMTGGLSGYLVPTMVRNVTRSWAEMWRETNEETTRGSQAIESKLLTSGKHITEGVNVATLGVRTDWKTMLDDMKQRMYDSAPTFEYGTNRLVNHLKGIRTTTKDLETSWSTSLGNMAAVSSSRYSSMANDINRVVDAQNKLNQALGAKPVPATSNPLASVGALTREASAGVTFPAPAPKTTKEKVSEALRDTPIIGSMYKGLDWVAEKTAPLGNLAPDMAPGPVGPVVKGVGLGLKYGDDLIEELANWIKNAASKAVPQLASGASITSPTLAMIGEYAGAKSNPEIVAPKSDMIDAVKQGMDDDRIVAALQRVEQAVRDMKQIQAVISRDAVGRAASDYVRTEQMRGRNTLPAL